MSQGPEEVQPRTAAPKPVAVIDIGTTSIRMAIAEIDAQGGVRVLKSAEVDILGDGSLDYPEDLLKELDDDYSRLREGRFAALAEDWEEYSATSGRRVTATLSGRKIQGQATGIDKDGALWIRTDSGLQERVTAGDIQHLRAYS